MEVSRTGEAVDSEASDENADEQHVDHISAERISTIKKNNRRVEYFVHWLDNSTSWEPLEQLVDTDGTENMALLRYRIIKDHTEDLYVIITFSIFFRF